MKREYIIHFLSLIIFFLLISVVKKWFNFYYLQFWLGGIIGTMLPDLDHFIYALYLKPNESSSKLVYNQIKSGNIKKTFEVLALTRNERNGLIFHSAAFEALFLLLAFWVTTSTGSLLGRGLVLSFVVHLLVDQASDLLKIGNLDMWFKNTSFTVNKERATLYLIAGILILLFLSFFF